jgi:stage IV sporulation protein B
MKWRGRKNMKKRVGLLLMSFIMIFQVHTFAAVPEQVVAVGKAVGIDVRCSGLLVVGFPEDSPAKDSGMHQGDLIVSVDGETVEEPDTLRQLLQEKSQVTLTALRQGRQQSFLVQLREVDGMKLIGANVKTEMAGIGTVTYYDPATSVFGALGHGITDGTTAKLFPIRDGFICKATILTVDKGTSGTPGMLQGAFDSGELLGQVTKNTPCGIFGTMQTVPEGETVSVASKDMVETGPAEVLCNVEGDQVERYSVEITRIYPMEDGTGRNMMLKVTDERLLEATGGIVQGMSGSPILQNGKLVGAVTHVLVSDPKVGYGIFIENMLEAA